MIFFIIFKIFDFKLFFRVLVMMMLVIKLCFFHFLVYSYLYSKNFLFLFFLLFFLVNSIILLYNKTKFRFLVLNILEEKKSLLLKT